MSFRGIIFRHRLLLVLCLLSLLLHTMTIAWVGLPWRPPAPQPAGAPLALRIGASAPATPATPARTQLETRQAAASDLAFAPQAVGVFAPAPLPEPMTPDSGPPPAAREALAVDTPVAIPASGDAPAAPIETAGYFSSAPAPSVRIDYRIRRAEAGAGAVAQDDGAARDEGAARLVWESDGTSYTLALDGVLGALSSDGGLDDAGIAPRRLRAPLGMGHATTLFDRRARTIASALGAWQAPLLAGTQDTATVLLQLGGIGLSDAIQVRNELRIWVAGADGARMESYAVLARETIETGLGPVETVHLARRLEQGRDTALLEVWLAPQHAWLPVQLRLSTPGGAVRTQTASAITYAAPAAD